MINVPDKGGRENQNTHFISDKFSLENFAVYRKICKYTAEPDRPQMTI